VAARHASIAISSSVFVDEESFKKYQPKTFESLVVNFREY